MKNLTTLLLISFLTVPVSAALDKHQQSALEQTQRLLKDPGQRMKAVNQSSKAQAAHQKANEILGSQQNVNKAYDMAAQMLGVIANEANGDPQAMQKILNEARSNPAALAERMPSEFKSMLKEMAHDLEGGATPLRK